MKVVKYSSKDELKAILERGNASYAETIDVVKTILSDVQKDGDAALFAHTERFDKFPLSNGNIKVTPAEIKEAYRKADKSLLAALKHAKKNISKFHQAQYKKVASGWKTTTDEGVSVGEVVTPIENVGCYVPGGRASYPSTVLMTCTPAKIAGVKRIVVVSPPPINPTVLVACDIAGVDEIYRAGGAQVIAALAYGTHSIKKVNKIVGPGNKYVTAAKMMVYGIVDIDMPAGPSEVLIIADNTSNPKYIALDLLAQAEHDPDAQSLLVTDSEELIEKATAEISDNKKEIKKPLGQIIAVKTNTTAESIAFANEYAAEHLEIATKNPDTVAKKIKNAGAIFTGPYSCVTAGDYASGGNHVLPTGGTARFASQLSVRDYLKTTSIQKITEKGLKKLSKTITTLAQAEGLQAHKKSVEKRIKQYFRV